MEQINRISMIKIMLGSLSTVWGLDLMAQIY